MKHGTRASYANRGCRCAPCKNANRGWSKRHLVGVYLPEEAKARFVDFCHAERLTPSHAMRLGMEALYRERGLVA